MVILAKKSVKDESFEYIHCKILKFFVIRLRITTDFFFLYFISKKSSEGEDFC